MMQKLVAGRARIDRAHGHGEKVVKAIEAIGMMVGGAVALIGGIRTLIDVIVPPVPTDQPAETPAVEA